jgi:cobalt/nickel transport system permease protein
MHISSLDSYRIGQSLLHQLDARVKLALTLAYILTVSLTPVAAWPAYVLLFALALGASVASELGLGFVWKRSLLALPFVLAAMPVIVTAPGQAVLSLHLGAWSLLITVEGLERFLSIALKSLLSLQMAVLLTATTPQPDLLSAMKALHLPRLLVAIIGLMWRYLFLLADEALRMLRAREARSAAGVGRSGGSLGWRARVTGAMAGTLFLRGYERSECIYNAMLSRGYDGSVRWLPSRPLSSAQRWVLLAGLVMLTALLGMAYLLV